MRTVLGRRSTVFVAGGLPLAVLLASGCADTPTSTPLPPTSGATTPQAPGGVVTLAPGGIWRASNGGLTLTFVRVKDSRCPAAEDIHCVWAGDGVVSLLAAVPGRPTTTIELHTYPYPPTAATTSSPSTAGTVVGWQIGLVRLEPANTVEGLRPSDYRATIQISQH